MKSGGLDNMIKSVYSSLPVRDKDMVVRRGGIAEGSVLKLDDGIYTMAVKTNSYAKRSLGMLTVHSCCNEVAASGAQPVALQLHLLFPEKQTESDVNYVLLQAAKAAEKVGVDITGIHAECSNNIRRMMLTCNVYGKCVGTTPVSASGAKPGDALILTRRAALEGSIIICNDFSEKAYPVLTHDGVTNVLSYSEEIDAVSEGINACKAGVNAMVHVSGGGVLDAVFNMCQASKCGAEVRESDISILEESRKLCTGLVIDPLRLASSGCMLISTANEGALMRIFKGSGVQASVIGNVRKKDNGVMILGSDEVKRRILAYKPNELQGLLNPAD